MHIFSIRSVIVLLLLCASVQGVSSRIGLPLSVLKAYAADLSVITPSAAGGGGLIEDGLDNLEGETDLPGETIDPRDAIVKFINYVLSFLTLIAVIAIIVAGFVLIFGMGSEASTGRAKKIILYTILGLIIIFFSRVIVGFFTQELATQFT